MKKIYFFITFLIFTLEIFAQDFLYQAKLEEVDSSGYYFIYLSPEVTSKLNSKFSDLRIYDKKNNEVSYIRNTEDGLYKTAISKEMKIIQNDYKKTKKHTFLLIHNPQAFSINNLTIIVDNPNNAEAWVNISGSNDLKSWNILKNNTRYMPEFSDSATAEIRISDLPESEYEYYRIYIFDFNKVVFNVNKILNYELSKKNQEFVEVLKPHFIQDDSTQENQTVVTISFSDAQYIDLVKFYVSKPSYYLRKAEIVKKDSATGKRIRLQYHDQNQTDFYLCSDSLNQIRLSRYFAHNLMLIVYNNNDKPLVISDIKAYQQKEYITAYLEKNKKYTVYFGNKNLPPPIYDLKFFKNKIPSNCPQVEIIEISALKDFNNNSKVVKVKPYILWIAFGIVILILAAISLKMFLSAKKKTDNEIEL